MNIIKPVTNDINIICDVEYIIKDDIKLFYPKFYDIHRIEVLSPIDIKSKNKDIAILAKIAGEFTSNPFDFLYIT
jgi:hypothetical protein